jgi:hypothetical protein
MTLRIREEHNGEDHRVLEVSLDGGDLHIDGWDRGPATALISGDGEYEWWKTVAARDVPRLVELLGGAPGEQIMSLLAKEYMGPKSYEFERILRESDIKVEMRTWGG